jgi:glucose/mannose-6-phosphate isomerase
MLDDMNVLKQGDPSGALTVASLQCEQTKFEADVRNNSENHQPITNIVVAGMGGSALAAVLAKSWLKSELAIPLEIVRTYDLPNYVNQNTLVIASSYSGNTEETLSCFEQATTKDAQIAIIASDGKLIEYANSNQIVHVQLPNGLQPRMAVIYNLRALVALLASFGIVSKDRFDEITDKYEWLKSESSKWIGSIPTNENYAKQLALQAVGKTAVFYGGTLTAPVAYKWKISWNENAKNLAFWNELPEFSHNEFLGWESHPVEKPFAIFDVVSNLEHPQIIRRFEITDRLLSGKRPKSTVINLAGESAIEQLLWGSILADFVSIYVAVLNGVDPTPVNLIEKLKQELA